MVYWQADVLRYRSIDCILQYMLDANVCIFNVRKIGCRLVNPKI